MTTTQQIDALTEALKSIRDDAHLMMTGRTSLLGKIERTVDAALAAVQAPAEAENTKSLQQRAHEWAIACFGADIAADKTERTHRFVEEALELAQACGCSKGEVSQLVDYVFARDQGVVITEVGDVLNTIAMLCTAHRINMEDAGHAGLDRCWANIEKTRAKRATKPDIGPLPEAPAEMEPVAVKVKPLVWVDGEATDHITAGDYNIYYRDHKYWLYFWGVILAPSHLTLAEAQAAAWHHHQIRIISSLDSVSEEIMQDAAPAPNTSSKIMRGEFIERYCKYFDQRTQRYMRGTNYKNMGCDYLTAIESIKSNAEWAWNDNGGRDGRSPEDCAEESLQDWEIDWVDESTVPEHCRTKPTAPTVQDAAGVPEVAAAENFSDCDRRSEQVGADLPAKASGCMDRLRRALRAIAGGEG
ncbi:hypothetical protein SAMN04488103_109162 [Gemmobacter aquatilis]|uniref:MazG nucleotide pyrophosphohydrolase domain-containing protein n=1 Tax=Gemmobacter aquatilis TaxID=933059 RepID=A0A1H8KR24_9RHOB|nr:hypothetical protein [Gemmobacter aquatilis]SEN94838.1 hypothetical protein SAMN04488103_109162 [Gemmobacter aquatilis]